MFRITSLKKTPSINVKTNFSRFSVVLNPKTIPTTDKVFIDFEKQVSRQRSFSTSSLPIETKPIVTAPKVNSLPFVPPDSKEGRAEQARRDAQDFLLIDIMPFHAADAYKFVADKLYRNVPVPTAILNLVVDEKTRLSTKDQANLTQQEKEFLANPKKTLSDAMLYYQVTREIQNDPKLTQTQKDEKINAFKKDISLDNAAKLLGKDKDEIQKIVDKEISKAESDAKKPHAYQRPAYFGLDPTSTAKESHDIYQVIDKWREHLGKTQDAKVQISVPISAVHGDLFVPYADGNTDKSKFEYYASSYPNAGGDGKDNKGEKLQGGGRQVMASNVSKEDMQITLNPSK